MIRFDVTCVLCCGRNRKYRVKFTAPVIEKLQPFDMTSGQIVLDSAISSRTTDAGNYRKDPFLVHAVMTELHDFAWTLCCCEMDISSIILSYMDSIFSE